MGQRTRGIDNIVITIPTANCEYALPFKTTDKIIELGGGENPLFRPNIDFRNLPTVDIVANLEKGIPVEDESYDGVYSNMLLEHIGWRHVQQLFNEIHRILKPNGVCFLVTNDLLFQCNVASERGKISIVENAMLFGGQEDTELLTGNYHKSGMSKDYAEQLAYNAGFVGGEVLSVPGCPFDMIIELYKL